VRPLLLACPGNEALASSLGRALTAERLAFELRRFPDGESFLRIDGEVRERDVIVVCTLNEPDAKLLPLVFIADTLRDLGAASVGLLAPYLAYMRQDCRFAAGEAVTSISFARLLSQSFDWLVTVDPHLHRWHALSDIYTIPAEQVRVAPLLSAWVRAEVAEPLLIGPDAESEQWVRAVAAAVPCPYLVLQKVRSGDRAVAVSAVPDMQRWSQHTPVLVDDIISTAHTLIEAVRPWVQSGGRAPLCVGVHAVFAPDAFEALSRSGAAEVVTTNTISHASNGIDVMPLLIEPLQRLLAGTRRDPARRVSQQQPSKRD
jgi:ribose-phosphate pyrophosphokinase